MTTFNDEPVLRNASQSPPAAQCPPAAQGPPAAAACLQASLLLRRRIHRLPGGGVGDEQALLAVCHLLDALSRGYAHTPTTVPGTVERAALRLADQLQRTESHLPEPHRTEPHRTDSQRAGSRRATAAWAPLRPGRT